MWYIEMGGMYNIKGQRVFGRKIFIDPDNISEVRKKFNNTDVYATILSYNKEVQNDSDLYGPMYLDLDLNIETEDDYAILKKDLISIVTYLELWYGIPKEYIKYYFTGKKGFHLIINPEIFDVTPDNSLNVYYKEIAKELNKATETQLIDTKIYDKKRLLRLVNSINSKTGLYKVPVSYEQIVAMSFSEMKAYASVPRPIIKVDTKTCTKAVNRFREIKELITKPKQREQNVNIQLKDIEEIEVPDCIQNIIDNGAAEGNRNNTTIILASSFLQNGLSYKDTLNFVIEWNELLNEPPLPHSEIVTTVASAYQQVKSGRRYGCTSIKECGLCVGGDCRLFK